MDCADSTSAKARPRWARRRVSSVTGAGLLLGFRIRSVAANQREDVISSSMSMSAGGSSSSSASATCSATPSHASPVNIEPQAMALDIEPGEYSIRLDYGTWQLKDLLTSNSDKLYSSDSRLVNASRSDRDNVFAFNGSAGGTIQVGRRYSDLDEYILRSIKVRTPSEHTFMGRRLPLEVQLWHEPSLHQDLRLMQQRRTEVKHALANFHHEVVAWGARLEELQDINRNYSFPSLSIEQDWVNDRRKKISDHGEDIMKQVWHLEAEMKAIDLQTAQLMERLDRADSARLVVLSLLIRSADLLAPGQMEVSGFVDWLAKAYAARQDQDVTVEMMTARGTEEDIQQSFEFSRLPYQGIADIGEATLHRVFTYEGSFTEPPCTPVVMWFVSPEPLIARSDVVSRLMNATASKANFTDVWWTGAVQDAPAFDPPLQNRPLRTAELSTAAFRQPLKQINSATVASLPWNYVSFYCGTFLILSVLMLCTTCGMCANHIMEK